jgi:hypothetical protein
MPPSESRDRAARRSPANRRRSIVRALKEPTTTNTSLGASGMKVPSTATVMPEVLVGAVPSSDSSRQP